MGATSSNTLAAKSAWKTTASHLPRIAFRRERVEVFNFSRSFSRSMSGDGLVDDGAVPVRDMGFGRSAGSRSVGWEGMCLPSWYQ
jgi:hypothetical protein